MPTYEVLDMTLSQDYAQIVLGMDELYRNKRESNEASLDREGLVPINLTSEVPRIYTQWSEVTSDLHELGQRYLSIADEIRRNYMQQQIGSLLILANWCSGINIPFRDKVRGFLYVNENPIPSHLRERLHDQLDLSLKETGYHGSLATKVAAWTKDREVPSKEVASVLKELLYEAKERVVTQMFPEIQDVEVIPEVVANVPYSAYCDYVNGKMYINGDLTYTYEALKHLATHEAFPGHTTHMRIRELGVQSGELPLDSGLVITNTASSSVFEGIGDNAIHFINWASTRNDSIFDQYQIIRSVSGMNATHMLHAEGQTIQQAREFLQQFAFGDDDWIASRLRFITHSLRSPFIYSYWRGNQAVKDIYSHITPENHNRFYQFLYKNMLSADTVKQFA